MGQINDNQKDNLSIDIGNEISKGSTIHVNVEQGLILTTTDKIKLVLIDTKKIMLSQREWWTPLGLFLSFFATICTADFKDTLGLPKDFWHAIFVLLSIGSFVWLIWALYKMIKHWGQDVLDKTIEQIKKISQ